MHKTTMAKLFSLLLVLTFTLFTLAQDLTHSVTLFAWPLSAGQPQKLAEISYDPSGLTASKILSYAAPALSKQDSLVRVGIQRPQWAGIATSASSFKEEYQKRITLHVDEKGEVWRVGFGAAVKTTSPTSKIRPDEEDDFVVEIVKPSPGPRPVLNRPVVLDAEGKLAEQKEPEKTFLQR